MVLFDQNNFRLNKFLGFWSGNLFLIAPFPDLCLLVPLYTWLTRGQCIRTSLTFVTSRVCLDVTMRALSREHGELSDWLSVA